MRRSSARRLAASLLAAPAVAVACGGLPPDAPLPQTITTIRFGLIACPGSVPLAGVVPLGLECQITAEVFDEWGIPIREPGLVWRSSDTAILSASGGGKVGRLWGFNFGSVTVTVGDRLGHVEAETRISVVPRR